MRENCQFWVMQTKETKHIENKSLNVEFQRYILFFISILWLAHWLAVYWASKFIFACSGDPFTYFPDRHYVNKVLNYQLNQKDTCINNENRYRETIIIQLRVAYGTIP